MLLSWLLVQVELDLLSLPGLELLTEPEPVLTFDLQGPTPLPLSGSNRARVKVCAPTTIQAFAEGHCASADCDRTASIPLGMTEQVADCIVSWFEADLGDGGWLSSGPVRTGSSRTGHWEQSVQLMQEPLHLAAAATLGDRKDSLEPGVNDAGLCWIEAEYIFDRVMLKGIISSFIQI